MKINKNTIQEEVIKGNLGNSIQMLLKLTNEFDTNLYNEVIMLSSRHSSLLKEQTSGIISDDNAKMNQNRINFALTQLLEKVNDIWDIQVFDDNSRSGSSRRTNSRNDTTILFLAANPKDSDPIRLDEEIRKIDEGLRRSKNRDSLNLVQKWAVQIPDLRRALLDEDPNIIHFSGHGSDLGRIYLEDPSGNGIGVEPKALANLFELFKDTINCVVLNACYSEFQAQEISKHINYVVGMNKAVIDEAAIAFSEAFYDAIGNGRDIEFAFKLAKSAIAMYDLKSEDAPVLIRKLK